jgi:hypothetical protein
MTQMTFKADDKCCHCFRDFADHNYVPDSIDEYACPVNQQESCYGYFTGGDPRKFFPDAEDCTPEELANHKRACEEADRLEAARDLPCPSGWYGNVHITKAPFGIGVSTIEVETCFELLEQEHRGESCPLCGSQCLDAVRFPGSVFCNECERMEVRDEH